MGWTYVGGAQNNVTTGTSVSITHGLTINSGDLVVAYVHTNDNGATTTATQGSGAAWTTMGNSYTIAGETHAYGIFWKVANASEPSSMTFGWDNSAFGGAVIQVATPTGTPVVDVTRSNNTNGSSTDITVSGITVSDDSIAFAFGGMDNRAAGASFSVDNSYAGVVTEPEGQLATSAYRIFTTGASTGTVTFTGTSTPLDVSWGDHFSFTNSASGPTFTSGPTVSSVQGSTASITTLVS